MDEKLPAMPHSLTLDSRSRLSLTGAREVLSFDDGCVVLHTDSGNLVIHGQQLRLKALAPQQGTLEVEGRIGALIYEEPRKSGGFWGRLLG